MNANSKRALAAAKERVRIYDLGSAIFPNWQPGKSCRSPFREDRHASFSLFDDGRRWKDFASGETGDAVDFLVKARGLKAADAIAELMAIAGTSPNHTDDIGLSGSRPYECRPRTSQAQRIATAALHAMPEASRQTWEEGVAHILGSESLSHLIEQWRAWPTGTVRTLAADGLMGSPLVNGKRGLAFAVQAPMRDDLDLVSIRQVGFHFRRRPTRSGESVRWKYEPNKQEHGESIPAIPFVLGAGFVASAKTIVVAEGQWDAITLAAAAGWLVSDAAWPDHVAVFGTRGADAWRQLITTWRPYWPQNARFVLFTDADNSGDRWKARGGFVEILRKQGHAVRVLRSTEVGRKDLNDLHRAQPLTAEIIAQWITVEGKSS